MAQPLAASASVPTTSSPPVVSNDALLFLSEGLSIYDGTRMSGEHVGPHVLPINEFAESSGRSNDADDDVLYARSLLGLLASPSSSHL